MQATAFLAADPATLAALSAELPAETITIVDFDGTLLLRNSTQLYLQTLRPRWIAAPLLSLLELVQPWRLLPGRDKTWLYRDWLRVLLLTLLLPWSPLLWRRASAKLARAHANSELLEAFASRQAGTVIVATYGVRFIVAPLLRAMGCAWRLPVSASFLDGFRLRRLGKAEALHRVLGAETLRHAVLVTDSEDDGDVLRRCRNAYLLPVSERSVALHSGYLPLQYMHHCKRQGENVILRTILFYDLFCLLLAYVPASGHKLLCALGLLLFQLAFWTIYELGNWENDCLGQRYEDQPHVPVGFDRWSHRVRPRQAWVWACVLAALCAACLAPMAAAPLLFAGLFLYLAAARLCYALYNRIDPKSRAFVYPFMQAGKGVALAVLLPAAPAGFLLLTSVLLVRQVRYVAYRYGRTREALKIPVNLYILICFLFLCLVLSALAPIASASFWLTAALIVVWHLQRGRRELLSLRNSFVWLPNRGGG